MDLKPIEIRQPEGPSFELRGHELTWQKWRMRLGFTPREGLVIHTVTYADQGRERPILYRASVADMVVPYGDPRPTYFHRNAFDVGEYGIGTLANALQNGCDCLGEIRYLDAVVNDSRGRAVTLPNAVCIHEEDNGILWKHVDWRRSHAEVRRSRRLVVSFIATVGNYEYGFYWYFYQDGTIELEVKMTGIISNGAEPPGVKPPWGRWWPPGLRAHPPALLQRAARHDGGRHGELRVRGEHGSRPARPGQPASQRLPSRGDPARVRGARVPPQRPATRALLEGREPVRPQSPGRAGGVQADAGRQRAALRGARGLRHEARGFHDPAPLGDASRRPRRYAAGDYPNQHPGGAGLPAYVQDDAPLENTDVVLWYTFGSHHIVRPRTGR